MAQSKRRASATWEGGLQDGKGSLSATGGVLNNTPFSFKTRFLSEDGSAGTNPEELLAAAHAGCFTMATGATMGQQGIVPTRLETKSVLTMDMDTLTITAIDLNITGTVPGIDQAKFEEIANEAKKNCIISRALSPDITLTLTATLV
ncbi:OsmC family peroxiredoxin [Fibrella sp. HMF5335]|uniref:OsmC family peroxiredoxin n=1 Tax=Fibrella rubiginis TaxID=2817060 RepID=A0A939GNE4_9BACT|nr:OsmC family peroxiredoxin [Fibrella rubiginis]MBO0939647.1 OsmC family peroxiredoxin [Fibrella rubiginis]